MEKTDGSITSLEEGVNVEQMLFTYSEEEKEEQRINKMNADLILKPQFITVDYAMLHKGYSLLETALYGFISYFLANNEKFYCTNEQLAEMLCVSENTITNAISKLKKEWLIDLTYRIKAWGWKIRFIRLTKSESPTHKICGSYSQNLWGIYNKKIENKKIKENINKRKFLEFVFLTDEEYNKLIELYGNKVVDAQIENLNNYIGQNGKDKYKSHYHALLNWINRAWIKKLPPKKQSEYEISDGVYDIDKLLNNLPS